MTQKTEEIMNKVEDFQDRHNDIKEKIRSLDTSNGKNKVFNNLKDIHDLISEILEFYDELDNQASAAGLKIPKSMRKDIHNMRHQINNSKELYMKSINQRSRSKLNKAQNSVKRVKKTLRTYEYRVDNNISSIKRKIRDLESANSLKEERSIMNKIKKIEELEREVKNLKSLVYHMYVSESSAKKIHKQLIDLHENGMKWVEARQIAEYFDANHNDVEKVLNGLYNIGLLNKKIRGGTNVYRDKTKSKD